jgi:G:T-mismatch repair DNA endonuclease (very short patch repair protein)
VKKMQKIVKNLQKFQKITRNLQKLQEIGVFWTVIDVPPCANNRAANLRARRHRETKAQRHKGSRKGIRTSGHQAMQWILWI